MTAFIANPFHLEICWWFSRQCQIDKLSLVPNTAIDCLNVFMYSFVFSLLQLAPEGGEFLVLCLLLNLVTSSWTHWLTFYLAEICINQTCNGNRTSQQHKFMRIILIKIILIDVLLKLWWIQRIRGTKHSRGLIWYCYVLVCRTLRNPQLR